jgi:SAM-dependent MidA family methyltransferase
LRYLLVERSSRQRERHREHLRLEHPSAAFPLARGDDEPPDAGGPITVSLADLPAVATVGVIVANELLDNLPFALCQRSASGWDEVLVGVDGDHLIEVLVEAPIGHRQLAEDLAPDAPVGARIPVQLGVWRWLAEARSTLERGRIVCFDYARSTAEMAADPGWLRTYRSQSRGIDPLIDPGTQDITTDVALDQLVVVAAPTLIRSQRDFLAAFGIEQLVESGRAVWAERAHLADLTALKARSRIREADALLDPRGLGGFTVMEWVVG